MNIIYQIGQTSTITKISTRMLRYYDTESILKPSLIQDNGYRLYSDADIHTLIQIKQLRHYHFSYPEIKELLQLYTELPKDIYLAKLQSLKDIADDYDTLIQELSATYQLKSTLQPSNPYDISVTHSSPFKALCRKAALTETELDTFLGETFSMIEKQKCSFLGKFFILFHTSPSSSQSTFAIEYCQPIIQDISIKNFELKVFDKMLILSTLHYGSYDSLHQAYSSLYTWLNTHGSQTKGPFREKYFVDASLSSTSHEFITEISVPISK